MRTECIRRNKDYNSVVIESKNIDFFDEKRDASGYTYIANAKYIDTQKPQCNHDVVFVANDFEELMSIIFRKKDSESYSSGNTILCDSDMVEKYKKYFYKDREGKGRYAACGGNMW